jgi:hypothetical protein
MTLLKVMMWLIPLCFYLNSKRIEQIVIYFLVSNLLSALLVTIATDPTDKNLSELYISRRPLDSMTPTTISSRCNTKIATSILGSVDLK